MNQYIYIYINRIHINFYYISTSYGSDEPEYQSYSILFIKYFLCSFNASLPS